MYKVCDAPILQYTPFESGVYDVATPGLQFLQVNPDAPKQRLIQLDRSFQTYRENKMACHRENCAAYYLESDLPSDTLTQVNQTLVNHLTKAYPDYFRIQEDRLICNLTGEQLVLHSDAQQPQPYRSLLDALACQIQADLAIWQWDGKRDWLAALHVCAPNYWAPADKIGQNFDSVHGDVPGMEKQRSQYLPMLKGLIHKPAFCRFIWDLKTTSRLNLHPKSVATESYRQMSPFQPETHELFVRVERQVLFGLPDCQAVLFLIRTYIYPILNLDKKGLEGIFKALKSMDKRLIKYKDIEDSVDEIQAHLKKRMAEISN